MLGYQPGYPGKPFKREIPYVTPCCLRAASLAFGPDFGWILVGKASKSALPDLILAETRPGSPISGPEALRNIGYVLEWNCLDIKPARKSIQICFKVGQILIKIDMNLHSLTLVLRARVNLCQAMCLQIKFPTDVESILGRFDGRLHFQAIPLYDISHV